MSTVNYVVVTPVRNEAGHIQQTINSMVAQSLTPAAWIIVDDGSTDCSREIFNSAACKHEWISVTHRPDRGFRKSGGGVIEAFYDGYAKLQSAFRTPHSALAATHWDFLVKLDGDLAFAPDYFARCFERFAADPKLGIGGGMVCQERNGDWIEDSKGDPPFHVRGATKIYRRACWEGIGGLLKAPGWDTLDELKANKLGFKTYTFRDIKILQLKSTGNADGTWRNWVKNGRANYITGYHPAFMLAKCLKRTVQKPYGVAALALLSGFVGGYLRGLPQVQDASLVRYVREQQLNRLLGRPSLWS